MPAYTRAEAKEWARATWRGACNVIIPSYSRNLRALNEEGIRHDVRRNIELGFWGALLVSETALSFAELERFIGCAVDEARGRHRLVLQLSFDTFDDIKRAAQMAEACGVDALLISHPNSFYPRSVDELRDYTLAVCGVSSLAIVLFCAPHFNFGRFHPSGYPLDVWDELVDHETVVALKYEVGQPGTLGAYECFRRFSERGVLVCDPYEPNLLVWSEIFEVPWVGTSNYEYLGDSVPRMLEAAACGRRNEAVDLYWRTQPARVVRERLRRDAAGANFNHRYLWKYQAWLMGYNGGPLRAPVMKLTDAQMHAAARVAVEVGLLDAMPDLQDFYVGRVPA